MNDPDPPTMVVFKYPLVIADQKPGTLSEIELPAGSTILRIGSQCRMGDSPRFYLWALVCKSVKKTEKRKWLAVGTGHEFSAKSLKDVAWISCQRGMDKPYAHQETVFALNGRLVFHFWVSYP